MAEYVNNNGTSSLKPIDIWVHESDQLITNETITIPYQKIRKIEQHNPYNNMLYKSCHPCLAYTGSGHPEMYYTLWGEYCTILQAAWIFVKSQWFWLLENH